MNTDCLGEFSRLRLSCFTGPYRYLQVVFRGAGGAGRLLRSSFSAEP